MPPKTTRGTRRCKFYNAPELCQFGSTCQFQHKEKISMLPPHGEKSNQSTRNAVHNQSQAGFREWRDKIPRENNGFPSKLGYKLPKFFQTAWKLFKEGSADIRQQIIKLFASNGGLIRIKEVAEKTVEPFTEAARLHSVEENLLPLLHILSHDTALRSPLLENDVGTIHTFLFGPNGERACQLYPLLTAYAKSLDSTTNENSNRIVTILTFLQKAVDINSTAKVTEPLFPIIETLSSVVSDETPDAANARYIVDRIRSRMGLGQLISSKGARGVENAKKKLTEGACFVMSRDLPGYLSPSGPRHDNDHVDIAKIQIMPSIQEIESLRPEYLPVHDPSQLHKPGLDGLIDRQFRLLREDTVGQLRDAVQIQLLELKNSQNKRSSQKYKSDARKNIYHNVRLEDINYGQTGLYALISFDQPDFLQRKGKTERKQWWDRSKSLGIDALVCVLSASGKADFMRVCLETPTNDEATNDVRMERLVKEQDRASALLRLVEPHEYDISRLVYSLSPSQEQVVLCEFPGVLLPSFYPTLKALQGLSSSLDLPFASLIAPDQGSVFDGVISPPRYATRPQFSFDLHAIASNAGLSLSPFQPFDYRALEEHSRLDNAQQLAVIEALTRCLSLIQGPPGTGKSYTGVALIKILLDNAKKADLGPIICVCYTNHALDQLLEHLVRGGVKQIIRIGARSKSELLKPLNLREAAKNGEQTTAEKRAYGEGKSMLEEATRDFQKDREAILRPGRLMFVKQYLRRENAAQFAQLFQKNDSREGEEDGWSVAQRQDRRNELEQWLKPRKEAPNYGFSENQLAPRTIEQLHDSNIWHMTITERHELFSHWQTEIQRIAVTRCAYTLDSAKTSQESLNQVKHESDLRCLGQAKVVGLTTSGLARNLSFMRKLRSKVLICEEAGEVLEAHLLTALLPSVEHAILIGDHQQLRPQIQNYELQSDNPRGHQYSLDVSLFERLVQPTIDGAPKLPLSDLRTQRRMHPSISQLIRENLYPGLHDDPSVNQYPLVEGVAKRLFWIDHEHPENDSDKEDFTSHSNDHEIGMTAALVSHLVRQGKYQSDDIAVITPYLGQFLKLRRKLSASFAITVNDKDTEELDRQGLTHDQTTAQVSRAERGTLLQALRIATVDNFQGEEAKIVVVSLVRSNKERKCGFLRTSNRINVLLSRAQHGMYLIGDADTYRNIDTWDKVIQILEREHNIGPSLALCCPRHPKTLIEVSTPDDFSVKAPEGGCDLMCEWRLDCGHHCINKCHSKLLHENVVCQEPCPRSRKGCDHSCENKCGYPCGLCMVQIPNVQLPCGHVKPSLPCHLAQEPAKAECLELMDRTVPGCGHSIKLSCSQGLPSMDMPCHARCNATLPCGHDCTRDCSECNRKETGQLVQSEHGACQKICGRQYNTCGHQCRENCHDGKVCPLCTAPCEVQCSHSKCDKPCGEPCAPCSEQCTWCCPHSGQCPLPCAVPCSMIPCSRRCEKMLDCRHQCPSVCGERCPDATFCQTCCDDKTRNMVVDYIMSSIYADVELNEDPILIPKCGHIMTMSSMDCHLGINNHFEISDEGRPIALRGVSQPFSSEELKNCPICRYPIRSINRYNRIVRRALVDESTKKHITWSNTTFAPLAQRVQAIESEFARSNENEWKVKKQEISMSLGGQQQPVKLHNGRNQFLNYVKKIFAKTSLFKQAFSIRLDVAAYQRKVSDQEQPFGRIWDLVENERRRKGISNDHFPFQANVLQPRSRLLGLSLAIRCDLAIISEYLAIRARPPSLAVSDDFRLAKLDIDFSEARGECLKLAKEAASKHQPLVEVEACIYFARFAALERIHNRDFSNADHAAKLHNEGLQQIKHASQVSEKHPKQVKGMSDQFEAVRRMLNDGTFYSIVTTQETQEVYAALSQEFRGTGHWYRCVNGHPFTVGECGMPMETSHCPQCGAQVGGQHHRAVDGVTRDEEFEQRMTDLNLNA